jgi:excinuclease ABC subunit B
VVNIVRPKSHLETSPFQLKCHFAPAGDQPKAIKKITENVNNGVKWQTLRGITGSGKTFTIANVIFNTNKPTLVIAPNKTLAAQLYQEFRDFFPENRVRYFVSYYDYYQPEAYIASTDTYIEKDSSINDEIDRMRHSATKALLEGTDTIIVASISCIYGLGAPEDYFNHMLYLESGDTLTREDVIRKLVYMQYTRALTDFKRGTFRVRGDTIDIFPSDQDGVAMRLTFFGDELEELSEIDSLTGKKVRNVTRSTIYPVSHFVTGRESIDRALKSIKYELQERVGTLECEGKFLEAQRLQQRTMYDLELMLEVGFCPGIENYSRHLAGRSPGSPPTTLLDYFPPGFLLIIDESHVTVPQLNGMYRGDQARKKSLVEYGFRLPSALDNRPLNAEEFWERVNQTIFVSATPADFEMEKSRTFVIEQINRPTGLIDPVVEIRPALHQIDDLIGEIKSVVRDGNRVLAITLTKKMAEELAAYLKEIGIKCRYLHADINTVERVEILRGLRRGDFDVLIGINLLREGLDLVEVALVAILDADKEGFLRSARSLIQTIGRAARNLQGRAILYADRITDSMRVALDETSRRRSIQEAFNRTNNIVPRSAHRELDRSLSEESVASGIETSTQIEIPKDPKELKRLITDLRTQMFQAAAERNFERAATLRDDIQRLQS